MSFGEISWSWNPITGCLHNCVTGDTKVLTADLTWKTIRDVEVGEEIVGFMESEVHGYRALVKAVVLSKYRRRRKKATYSIRGASSSVRSTENHLWLVNEGERTLFKGTREVAKYDYPIKLLGSPVEQPLFSIDYMRGYIASILCDDNSARLSIRSIEAINRVAEYLSSLGICRPETLREKPGERILFREDLWDRNTYERILDYIRKGAESPEYMKGFLAGIYDTKGSYSSGILRISSRDASLRRKVMEYGRRLGFQFRCEEEGVLLASGLVDCIRFFATTFPAVREKKNIFGETIKSTPEEDVDVEKDGEDFVYDISTTTGTFIANGFLAHNCSYCWARRLSARLASMGIEPYKTHGFNPTLTERRLKQRIPEGKFIFVSDMGDMWGDWVPREWIERVLKIVRSKPRSKFFFLTKNPKRYLEFEDKFSENVVLGVTLETNRDYKLSRAPTPRERYEAMVKVRWRWKAIVIEPILDFDEEFIDWIYDISPEIVYVGYDNYGNKLPEPKIAKTMVLLEALRDITNLRPKTIRKAWNEI